MDDQARKLLDILRTHSKPSPAIVSKLPKGGNKDRATWKNCNQCGGWHAPNAVHLDYVGHADITRLLIEIDPLWSWQPMAWDNNGRPAINVVNGIATMWGMLTVHGKPMLGVGSCDASKPDQDKELIGDLLRNCAMRYGLALSLWTKQEWDDLSTPADTPKKPRVTAVSETKVITPTDDKPATNGDEPVDIEQVKKFIAACEKANLDHDMVADKAGVSLTSLTNDGMTVLRKTFKELTK